MPTIEDSMIVDIDEKPTPSIMENFIAAVQEVFGSRHIDQKTRLTHKNVRGIIKTNSLNEYLKTKSFGKKKGYVQVPVLKALCDDKMVKVISIRGKGRDEVIEMFKATAGMGFESQRMNMMEKMLGRY